MLRALFAVALLAGSSASYAADCGTITGWVGVPLCQEAAGPPQVPTTNVIGAVSAAAADAALMADGLDLGGATDRCSAEPDNEVVGQSPAPGVLVDLGTLVDILVSNGIECANSGRNGVRLKGMRMRGL